MKKHIIWGLVTVLVVGGLSFYGGMKYAQSKSPTLASRTSQNGQRMGINRNSTGFIGGEILSKDDKSITIKLKDGGSKIAFFASSTIVSKNVNGSIDDVSVGNQVTVSGVTNSDGSVSAQMVQIVPNRPSAGQ